MRELSTNSTLGIPLVEHQASANVIFVTQKEQAAGEASGFDAALARLQQIVKGLEAGDMSLEDSLKCFEEGVQLVRSCQTHLSSAEQRVEQLVRGGDERTPPETTPFSVKKQ